MYKCSSGYFWICNWLRAGGGVGEFSCSGRLVKFHLGVQTTGNVILLAGTHSVTGS